MTDHSETNHCCDCELFEHKFMEKRIFGKHDERIEKDIQVSVYKHANHYIVEFFHLVNGEISEPMTAISFFSPFVWRLEYIPSEEDSEDEYRTNDNDSKEFRLQLIRLSLSLKEDSRLFDALIELGLITTTWFASAISSYIFWCKERDLTLTKYVLDYCMKKGNPLSASYYATYFMIDAVKSRRSLEEVKFFLGYVAVGQDLSYAFYDAVIQQKNVEVAKFLINGYNKSSTDTNFRLFMKKLKNLATFDTEEQ